MARSSARCQALFVLEGELARVIEKLRAQTLASVAASISLQRDEVREFASQMRLAHDRASQAAVAQDRASRAAQGPDPEPDPEACGYVETSQSRSRSRDFAVRPTEATSECPHAAAETNSFPVGSRHPLLAQ